MNVSTPAAADANDSQTPYVLLGGAERLRALVDRFYDLMDGDSAYREIRDMHEVDLVPVRDKLYWFLSGWLGGPNLYVERLGHPRLRARHLPFPIGINARDQWLACMTQAMRDTGISEPMFGRLLKAFTDTADWMRNLRD